MPARAAIRALLATLLALLACQGAVLASAPAADPVEEAIRRLVVRELGPDAARQRIELTVGQLDSRVQLAPCARAEPFVPPGSRLWGRTQVGIRCTSGASWMVRLPVHVQVYGPAAVAAQPLAAGAIVGPNDFRIEEIELSREPAPLVGDPTTLAGKQLTRPVAAGQPVRVDAVRVPPTINPGDPVQIVVTGQGFTLSGSGVALAAASDGQVLRARTESGRVVSGTLRDRILELRL